MTSNWLRIMFLLLCILFVSAFLTGCWNQRELDEIALVTSIGVDKAPEDDAYLFTFQIVIPRQISSGQGGGGGEQATVTIISQKGETLFEAIRRASQKTPNQLFFPHSQLFIFSEEVAKDGLKDFMDFFERDHEMRPLTTILIVKGNDAKTVLDIMAPLEKIPSNNLLKEVKVTEEKLAFNIEVDIDEVIQSIALEGKEPFIGGIMLIGNPQEAKSDNIKQIEPKAIVGSDGIALFRGGELQGWLKDNQARGLLWVLGKVKSTLVKVNCKNKEDNISIEIIRSKTSVRPQIKNGKTKILVMIKAEASIGETGCYVDFMNPDELVWIQEKVEKLIKKEANSAIDIAKSYQVDPFGFGASIHKSYPKQWGKLKKDWNQDFAEIEAEIKTDVYIRRSGIRNTPLKNK
ncbi:MULTISPECIES: Ger(x)C family spore germination protein [Bacillus]|uniref:Uncharacterized protein n=2 Tax=Bacillus TaxID=1386 RepID=A0A0M3RAW0_9BACI|nr:MULTISPECIES: Ger(x)C family spore germination protein [Bacillus]ALC83886.1 hypothetical protein AM592_22045 [Bacillus gobiensis]MBP1083061.1 spore germination protein KC [Bacillus capparidis]MED1097974.1 Ger(x)C family spore germination protein [Bacillus capparidis]